MVANKFISPIKSLHIPPIKMISKEPSELTPIYESFNHYQVERPRSSQKKTYHILPILCSILFVILLCLCCFIILLIPSLYFGIQKVVGDQCSGVFDKINLPQKNFSLNFESIRYVKITMPSRGVNTRHSLTVESTTDSKVRLQGFIRALDTYALSKISLSIENGSATRLVISFNHDYQWPGYGCPTVLLTLGIPRGVVLEALELDNQLNGPTSIIGISSKSCNFLGGYARIDLANNIISKLTASNYAGEINVLSHQCEQINTTTTFMSLTSPGNINVDHVNWCNGITIAGTNGRVFVRNINYWNTTLNIVTRDGNQELSSLSSFREVNLRSLSGAITVKGSGELPSTYFEISSGSGRARVDGFTRVTYDENEPSRKRGRMGCASNCEKAIRATSIRGTISLLRDN